VGDVDHVDPPTFLPTIHHATVSIASASANTRQPVSAGTTGGGGMGFSTTLKNWPGSTANPVGSTNTESAVKATSTAVSPGMSVVNAIAVMGAVRWRLEKR